MASDGINLDQANPNGSKFDDFIERFKFVIIFLLIGVALIAFGIFLTKTEFGSSSKVQILEKGSLQGDEESVVVEISGAVEKPGVYKLTGKDRVEDVIILAGGVSSDADRGWIDKYLNRAEKLTDGQKIYIPFWQSTILSANKNGDGQTVSSEFSKTGEGLVNINTATAETLDTLPGIGPVYAQNIIEQRPYSSLEDFQKKGVIPQSTYEKIKEKITIY
jgi:competence protein ComEA